jgi:hypothetical protein
MWANPLLEARAVRSPQLQDLLHYVSDEGRICPQPGKWHELWEMLPDRYRVGSGWNPPLPLILAAWDHTSGLEKMLRLRQHIEYAEEKGVLDLVEKFLKGLPQEEWHIIGK